VSEPRVVITDLGIVAASGVGTAAFWDTIEAGRTCIGPVRSFDASVFPAATGAELHDVPRAGHEDDERAIHLLLEAGNQLGSDLRPFLRDHPDAAARTAVVLGTSQGAILGVGAAHRRLRRGGGALTDDDVRAFEAYRPGYGTSRLAEHLGARGSRATLGMVCVSSAMAMIHGAEMIRSGAVDRVVAGGFEGFSAFIFTGFHCIGALSKTKLRPFDERRDGTLLGDGAVLLVLESERAARERGATPLAFLEGGGFAADGVHITAPDREGRGLERAMRQALAQADIQPREVDYISAHGTGTPYNDAMECKAFARVFSDQPEIPPLSSVKGIFGHTLGAAGAIDAAASVLALQHQVLPPNVNGGGETLIEDWDFVGPRGRPVQGLDLVLSTNAAMAGNNTALVLRRYEG